MSPDLEEAIELFEGTLPEQYLSPFKALRSQLTMSFDDIRSQKNAALKKLEAAEELSRELSKEILRLNEGRKKDRYKRFGATSEAHPITSSQEPYNAHEEEEIVTETNDKKENYEELDDASKAAEMTSAGRQSSELPDGLNSKERHTKFEISHCPEPGCGFPVRHAGWHKTERITADIKYKRVVEYYERCECQNCSWAAAAPRRFLSRKCSVDTSFLAEAVADKFFSGMPYYRPGESHLRGPR